MFDLGTSFLASVERDGSAEAIVEGTQRLTYSEWYAVISNVATGLRDLGLVPGDHLMSVLQNRFEAATLHWACQFTGIIMTPLNWRAKPDDVDFAVRDSEARAIVFEPASEPSVSGSETARHLPHIAVGSTALSATVSFDALARQPSRPAMPQVDAEAWSLMLYTSGTTARPKGVPRRHRAERAAAIAHVAQNQYGRCERTLGIMPLYHTMGVRSLLAMSLIGGCFICLPRFRAEEALTLIERERIDNLYLVPTLYHDLLAHPAFGTSDITSVRKLGFAGAPMPDGLLKALTEAFRPELFVNHYGSSEIYTYTVEPQAARKPGSAGRPGINERLRVVALGSRDSEQRTKPREEGEIAVSAASDEAFEGYWRRPEANERAFRSGWYFTGDMGFVDEDGDLFVTGRVDDMIITGGENISPVEVESCLSLHQAVAEVAVAGLPDERWGKIVTAFVRRLGAVEATELDAHCRASGLADFKRPRRYVFVAEIPRSPVGKLLRRKLTEGEYQPEPETAGKHPA